MLDASFPGTAFDDVITLRDVGGPDGMMEYEISSSVDGVLVSSETIQFVNPTGSLEITGLDGNDVVTIESLDAGFSADLLIYGHESGAADRLRTDNDSVVFAGDINTGGGYLEAFADNISVNAGVRLSTNDGAGNDDDIVFRARRIANADLENLTPLVFFDRKSVDITIGQNATLEGAGVFLVASAEDRTLAEQIGTTQTINNFVIDPLISQTGSFGALPVKVIGKESSATVTVEQGATIIGSGPVGLYATSASDASGQATSRLFSVGYAHAVAESVIDIQSGANISAGDALVVTSDASATANMTSETSRDDSGGALGVGLSLAVTYADVTSSATLADGATLTAGRTANIRSLGTLDSDAESKSAREEDGSAALAFAIELSDADVHTTVDGDITALMNAPSTVKIEIDPTETDPNRPGFVDYARNMINVGGTGLVTEDTIEYSNRRGNSIGRFGGNGLIDGETYVVISVEDDPVTSVDESDYIQLALTNQQAIDGEAIDLEPDPVIVTATNNRSFDGSNVDATGNSITLDTPAGTGSGVDFSLLGQTFELGQAVIYREGSAPIPGLVDGTTYYVITALDQFDLQGDSRFVDQQVIQLAEREHEARGGVAIDIGPVPGGATGYTLAAAHVLDSGLATGVGVQSSLNVKDRSSAEAGLSRDTTSELYPSVLTQPVADSIFTAFSNRFTNNSGMAGAGASNSLQVGGALAVSVGTHDVATDVGGTSNLKSNEDLVITATIDQAVQLNAQSETDPDDDDGAPNTVSTALDVGVLDNNAVATVHEGARLDGLRNTRVVSIVEYPFLTSPDQFVPTTLSEFTTAVETEGIDSIGQYLGGTLGLREGLVNSWAGSSADSSNVALAGSVNVLVFNDTAEAIVEDNVRVNQDVDWRNNALNPHPNQASQQPDGLGEQVFSVEASNRKQLINIAGVFSFDLPALNIDPADPSIDRKFNLSPVASSGEGGGAGGAIFVQIIDHKTHAIVGDGAQIYSGQDGGFNMKAEELILDISLGQAGAAGGRFGVGGTVLYTQQTSDTLAQLSSTAIVTGRNVEMYAASLALRANLAGGVARSENIGVGVGVAANYVDRNTRAVIGDPDTTATDDSLVPGSPTVTVSDDVRVRSFVGGQVWSFAVAGAASTGQSPDQPGPGESGPGGGNAEEDPLDGVSLPALFGEDIAPEMPMSQMMQRTGVGLAGAVSVNIVNDHTQASIADAGTISARDVSVLADNDVQQVAAAGGAAFSAGSSAQSNNALAGGFSFNNLDIDTLAFVVDTEIDATNVTVDSRRTGDLITVTAGAAGSTGNQGFAVAGSVAVNRLVNSTDAYVDGGDVTTSGDLLVTAGDDADLVAGGGGGALSGATGVGFSIGVNQIDTSTRAVVSNSTLDTDGRVDIASSNDNALRSVGVSAGAGRDSGIAFTLGVNLIMNDVVAELVDSTIVGAASVDVSATDDSNLQALGGTLGVGLNGTGFGGALGWNSVTGDVRASINRSTLSSVSGDVSVSALTTESDPLLDGKILAIGVGAAGSSQTVIGGALGINVISTTTSAGVVDSSITAGGDVAVTADDAASIRSLTGGAALGTGNAGFGAAVSNNDIFNTVAAVVQNSQVAAANVSVEANGDSSIESVSLGLAGAEQLALGGSVSINVIQNTVDAHISGDASTIDATGDVTVSADDTSTVDAVSGAVGAARDAAVGAAIATNTIGTVFDGGHQVRASIVDAAVSADRHVFVSAESVQDVDSLAVAGSGAQSFAIGGAITAVTTEITTEAFISGSATVTADGTVDVSSDSDATINSIAGALAVSLFSETVSVAVSASNSTVLTDDNTRAWIGSGADVTGLGTATSVSVPTALDGGRIDNPSFRGVSVAATSTEEVNNFAAGAAVAVGGEFLASFALAGSSVVTVLDESTEARIDDGALINQATGGSSLQGVNVFAWDATELRGAAGGIGGAVWAGAGAGIDVGTINKSTTASIDGSVNANGDIAVQALAEEDVLSISVAGGVGGVAGAGAVSVISIGTAAQPASTTSHIETGAVVNAGGAVLVSADDRTEVDMIAGGLSAGGVALGGAVGVTLIDKDIDASIRPGASVTANATTAGLSAATGGFAESFAPDVVEVLGNEISIPSILPGLQTDSSDTSLILQRRVAPHRGVVNGVAVTAVNRDDLESYAVTGGLGNDSIQLSGSTGIINVDTTATIDGADVSSDAAALVTANSDLYRLGIGGAGAIGFAGSAASPGLDLTISNRTTQAGVTGAANVEAADDVDVNAHASDDLLSIAATLAGSQNIAVTAAVAAIDLTNDTLANIGSDATVDAGGDVSVSAQDQTDTDVIAGGFAASTSTAGAGAGLGLTLISKDATATVDGTVNLTGGTAAVPTGDLSVIADTSENVFSTAASGAVGMVGFAGAVNVQLVDSDTTAALNGSATNDAGPGPRNVDVRATNDLDLLSIAGSVAGGPSGALAGGADAGIIRNDTAAAIGNGAAVDAALDVSVEADATKDIDSFSLSAGASGTATLTAAVTVYSIGGMFSDTYSVDGRSEDPLNGSAGFADGQRSDSGSAGALTVYTDDDYDPDALPDSAPNGDAAGRTELSRASGRLGSAQSGNPVQVATSTTDDTSNGTAATIGAGATVRAGGDVTVSAADTTSLDIIAGSASGGLAVGAGAGIAIVNIGSETRAAIDSGAVVRATGDVHVEATATQNTDVLTLAGTGGALALGASVAVIDNNNRTIAEIDGANVRRAGDVRVLATNTADVETSALAASVGGIAAGASVVDVEVGGDTTASLGADTRIGSVDAVDSLTVHADSMSTVAGYPDIPATPVNETTMVAAIGGAVLTGVGGSASTQIATDTSATLVGSTTVDSSGPVNITAQSDNSAEASAIGAGLGIAAVGLVFADAEIGGSTTADAGIGSINASGVTVSAASEDNASSTAIPAVAAAFAGAGADADAVIDHETKAAAGGTIDAGSGTIDVLADGTATADATAGTAVAGLLGLGFADANASVGGMMSADVASDAVLTAGDVNIRAGINRPGPDLPGSLHAANATVFSAAGGVATGGRTRASASANPTLRSSVGDGAEITAVDDIRVDTDARVHSDADARGVSRSGINVTTSDATAITGPNVSATVGDNASLDAADRIDIAATLNRGTAVDAAQATSTSSNGSLLLGVDLGTNATVLSNPTVSTSIGTAADVLADNAVVIRADALNQTRADADGNNSGLVTEGGTSAQSTTSTAASSTVGDGARVGAGNRVTVESVAESRPTVRAEGGTGRSLGEQFETLISGNISEFFEDLSLPSLYANGGTRAAVTDNTRSTTTVDTNATVGLIDGTRDLVPNSLNLIARSTVVVDSDATQRSEGATAVSAVAVSDVQVNADATVQINGNADVHGNNVDLIARNRVTIDSLADSVSNADVAGSFSTAISRTNLGTASDLSLATIHVNPGASVTGDSTLDIEATGSAATSAIDSRARSRATTLALATATASSEGSVHARSDVLADDDTNLVTRDLGIDANTQYFLNRSPDAEASGFVTRVVQRVRQVVRSVTRHIPFFGSLIEDVVEEIVDWVTVFEFSDTNTHTEGIDDGADDRVVLNGTISLGTAQDAVLVVDAVGNITQETGVDASVGDSQVAVTVVNDADGRAEVRATRGQISGDAEITLPKVLGRVDIDNQSNRDLIVNRIDTISANNGEPDTILIDIDGSAGSDFTYSTGATSTVIDINNAGPSDMSDVVFTQSITNVVATLNVDNPRGNIETADSTVEFEFGSVGTPAIRLDANGDIGRPGRPIDVNLVRPTPGSPNARLEAIAGGSASLHVAGVQVQTGTSLPPVVDGFEIHSNAGGDLDVVLRDGLVSIVSPQAVPDGSSSVVSMNATPRDTVWQIDAASAGNDLSLVTAGSRTADIVLAGADASAGHALIDVSGDITHGDITDGDSTATNLTANSATLRVGGSFGTSSIPLETDVRSLEASIDGGGFFASNTGSLTIGGVDPALDGLQAAGDIDVDVAADGSLVVTEDVAAAGAVELNAGDSPLQRIAVRNGGTIVAGGSIDLIAGGTVRARSGSAIDAGTSLSINPGQAVLAGFTAITELRGGIVAPGGTTVTGGDADDQVTIAPESIAGSLSVDSSDGQDVFEATTTDGLQLTLRGGSDSDVYMVNLTGSSNASVLIDDVTGADQTVTVNGTPNNDPITLDADSVTVGTEQVDLASSSLSLTVNGRGGDDTITAVESLPRATGVRGNSGEDTAVARIDGDPAATDLTMLNLDVELLVVDNTAFGDDVDWTVGSGGISVEANQLISTDGVDHTRIQGGSGLNELNVVSEIDSDVTATIDNDRVELIEGLNVLSFADNNNALTAGELDGLAGASRVAATSDGQFVFVAGTDDDAVTIFRRPLESSVSAAWAAAVAGDSPLNWYRLNDSGAVATDEEGRLNGTYAGVDPETGTVDGARRFRENSDHIELDGAPVTGAWTAEFILFNDGRLPGDFSDHLLEGDLGNGDSAALKLDQFFRSGQLGYTVFGEADYLFSTPVQTPVGETAHIAFVGEPGIGVRVYVNGELASGTSATTPFISLPRGRVGSRTDSINALVDEVVLYDTALSSGQIRAHADSLAPEFELFQILETDLDSPVDVVISPDDRYAYVAVDGGVRVLEFNDLGRWESTGAVNEPSGSPTGSVRPIRLLVTADGQNVYAVNPQYGRVRSYQRRPNGTLQFRGLLTNQSGSVLGTQRFDLATSIQETGNGDQVTVAFDGGVAFLDRDPTNDGRLSGGSVVDDHDGLEVDTQSSVWISPDGRYAYTLSPDSGLLRVHTRDQASGAINETIQSVSITNPLDLEASPDGEYIYVLRDSDSGQVEIFERNLSDGRLTNVGSEPTSPQIPIFGGTRFPDPVSISVTDSHVFALSRNPAESNIRRFSRNAGDGTLQVVDDRNFFAAYRDIVASPVDNRYFLRTDSGFEWRDNDGTELASVNPTGIGTARTFVVFRAGSGDQVFIAGTTGMALYFAQPPVPILGANLIRRDFDSRNVAAHTATIHNRSVYLSNADNEIEILDVDSAFEIDLIGTISRPGGLLGDSARLALFDGPDTDSDPDHLYAASEAEDVIYHYSGNHSTILAETIEDVTPRRLDGIVDATATHGFTYVITTDGEISVFDDSTGNIIQTIDDLQLTGATSIAASPDGDFISVATSSNRIVTIERESNGRLTTDTAPATGSIPATAHVAIAQRGLVGSSLLAVGGSTGQLDVFHRNGLDGTIDSAVAQRFVDGDPLPVNGLTSLVTTSAGFVYGVNSDEGVVGVLDVDTSAAVPQLVQTQGLRNGIDSISGLSGASGLAVDHDEQHLYVAATEDNGITRFEIDGIDGSLSDPLEIRDVAGLTAPQSVVASSDGDFVYAGGASGLAVFARSNDGRLTHPPGDLAEADATLPATDIVDLSLSPDGDRLYAVSRSENSLLVFDRDTETGRLTPADVPMLTDGTIGVTDLAAPRAVVVVAGTGVPSSVKEFVIVASKDDNAVTVFAVDATTGELTAVQTVRDGRFGVRGLRGASDLTLLDDFLFVTGEDSDGLAVFQLDAGSGRLTFTQVLRNNVGGVSGLNAPMSVAAGDGTIFVGSTSSAGLNRGGVAVLSANTQQPAANVLITSFSGIDDLVLETDIGHDTVTIRNAAPVATTTILTRAGRDRVTLNDLSGETTLHLGPGTDHADIRADAPSTELAVNGGNGDDDINVMRVGTDTTTELNGGDGEDVFVVSGANIPAGERVAINGNDPTTTPGDTLWFDPGEDNGEQRDVLRFAADGTPLSDGFATPAGEVQADGAFGRVDYHTIEFVQAITPPAVDAGGPYTVREGEPLELAASVETFGNVLESVTWDLDGDGNFSDADGLSPMLTAEQLAAFGIADGTATYAIAVRAISVDANGEVVGTGDAFATLSVTNEDPTLTVSGPATVGLGQTYAISFSATDPGDDRITSWTINWGDSTSPTVVGSESATATHVYTNPGNVAVVVSATDEDGTTSAAPFSVTVTNAAPAIGQIVPSSPIVEASPFTLTVVASDDAGTDGLTYEFDFSQPGDGTFEVSNSTGVATHTFDDNGIYDVTVRVTDAHGESTVLQTTVSVDNAAPAITSAIAAGSFQEGTPGTFSVTASDPAGTNDTLTFDFDFDNDGIYDANSATGQVSHAFADDGSFTVGVRVRDEDGGEAASAIDVEVANVAPIVTVSGSPAVITEGGTYTLNLGPVTDPGADTIAAWQINWGDGTIEDITGNPTSVSHTYADDGVYEIGALAIDEDGSFAADELVTFNVNATTSMVGEPYLLDLAALDPNPAGPWRIVWGDGLVDFVDPVVATINHVYSQPGGYAIEASHDTRVIVNNVAPSAVISGPALVDEGLYTLDLALSDPGDDTVAEWIIDWGDGSDPESIPGDAASATHTYDGGEPSTAFTISATVIDEDGTHAANTLDVTVNNLAPTILSAQVLTPLPLEASPVTVLVSAVDPLGESDGPLTYEFDFDGDSVFEQSGTTGEATHTFDDDGTYGVGVRVTDDDGGFTTGTINVTVGNVAPVATATGSAADIDEGSDYQLTVSIDDPGDDSVIEYVVDWGDGNVETIPAANLTPIHQYDGPIDVVPAVVSITDEDGTYTTLATAGELHVNGIDPTQTVTPSATSFLQIDPLTLTFGPLVDPGDDTVFQYSVEWGDGTIETFSGAPAAGLVLTHNFVASGDLTLSVTLFDEDGSYAIFTTQLEVIPNSPPTADAGGPYTVDEGGSVSLSAAGTIDAEQDPATLAYAWDLDGDGLFGETGPDAARGDEVGLDPTFNAATLDGPDTIVVGLQVTDEGGLVGTATTTIDVTNVAPTLDNVRFPRLSTVDGRVRVHGDFSDPGMADSHEVTIVWGDGNSTVVTVDAGDPREFDVTYDYASAGMFDITVTVADDDGGGSGMFTENVSVVGVAVQDGVLKIIGTNADDDVLVSKLFNKYHVFTNIPGFRYSRFHASTVNSVYAHGHKGHDGIFIGLFVSVPTELIGGGGNDDIRGGRGPDVIRGGRGDDRLFGGLADDTLVGGKGNDVLKGSFGDDVIKGGHGNDWIDAGWGDDTIKSGDGDDVVRAGHGDDEIFAGAGHDWISAGFGNDHVRAGNGDDTVYAGHGDDSVDGGAGDDWIIGGSGHDLLFGGPGHDNILGDAGHDILVGGDDDDWLHGGSGRDLIIGGAGSDTVIGGSWDDLLIAGTTSYDSDSSALEAIRDEWTSHRSYAERIDNLRNGTGPHLTRSVRLAAGDTVHDDSAVDTVFGQSGRDWFFAALDGPIGDNVFKWRREVVDEL